MDRNKTIVKVSLIGIAANMFLAAFKAVVGLAANSIAVLLDAVNNLSDAFSSIITIVGTKLANRKPDKNHPLGHGRYEYITAMVVSFIVLYAGITSAVESVKKIIEPEKPDYKTLSLVIIAVAVLVKIVLGWYVKSQGKKVRSSALIASGTDAFFDAVLSSSVLVSAIIFITTGVSLEAYVGVVISIIIIKSGWEILSDTLNDILGRRADTELTRKIKDIISNEPGVRGAYDLVINNYGPDKNIASVHIELPEDMTVKEMDVLTRSLEEKVFSETGVFLTGVGVYSYNTHDDGAIKARNEITKMVMAHDYALQMHGFFMDSETKEIRFDVVISFDVDQREAVKEMTDEVKALYPDYDIRISPDVDVTDI